MSVTAIKFKDGDGEETEVDQVEELKITVANNGWILSVVYDGEEQLEVFQFSDYAGLSACMAEYLGMSK